MARRKKVTRARAPQDAPRSAGPPNWSWWLLAAVAILPFLASLGADFTIDDHPTVEGNPLLSEIGWRVFADARFVRTFSIMLDRALFGMNPVGYHVTNLLLHAGASLLSYALLLRFAKDFRLALVGAGLFAIHPVHVEVITNIANRKETLCFLFSLASFACYVRTLERFEGWGRWRGLAATGFLGILALGAKQVAIVLPLVALTYEALFVPRERRLLLHSPWVLAACFIVGAGGLVAYIEWEMGWSTLLDYRTVQGFLGDPTPLQIGLSSPWFFWRYIELLLVPVRLCADHVADATRIAQSALLPVAWLGLAGVVAVAVLLRKRAPITAFGLWWIVLHLLPTVNLIPSAYALADRYLYIPSLGLCLLLVGAAQEFPVPRHWVANRGRWVGLAAGTVAAVFLVQAVSYNRVWLTEETLWRDTLQCEPHSFRAHLNVGSYDYLAKSYRSAREHFQRAVSLKPEDARAHFNLGNAERHLGRFGNAATSYAKAAELGLKPAEEQLRRLRSQGGSGDEKSF